MVYNTELSSVEYSVVRLRVIPAIKTVEPVQYHVYIESPRLYRQDTEFSVPKRLIVNVSEFETADIELLPSQVYAPIGRYQVTWYEHGQEQPVDKQVWIVPRMNPITIHPSLENGAFPAPPRYYSVVGGNTGYEYVLDGGLIHINPVPEENITLPFTYQEYLTIDQVLERDYPGNPGEVRVMRTRI